MATPLHRLSTTPADRYIVERELGAGGMATVYLAHDSGAAAGERRGELVRRAAD
jgi:hypothetical protein